MKRLPLAFQSYAVVEDAVEVGLRLGYHRAHKHTDTPYEEIILEHMEREVMTALCEVVDFDK